MSIFFFLWALFSVPTQATTTTSIDSSATYVSGGDRPPKKPVTPRKAVILEINK